MRIVINIERRNAKLSKDMNCKRTIKRIIMMKQFLNIFIFHGDRDLKILFREIRVIFLIVWEKYENYN